MLVLSQICLQYDLKALRLLPAPCQHATVNLFPAGAAAPVMGTFIPRAGEGFVGPQTFLPVLQYIGVPPRGSGRQRRGLDCPRRPDVDSGG